MQAANEEQADKSISGSHTIVLAIVKQLYSHTYIFTQGTDQGSNLITFFIQFQTKTTAFRLLFALCMQGS